MVICNGKQVQFHLAEKGSGEPLAKCCRENSVLPETSGAGAASLCLLSVPLPQPKMSFAQGELPPREA